MKNTDFLNEKGANLKKIKSYYLKGKDLEILDVAISLYPKNIQNLIKDNSVSLDEFLNTLIVCKEYKMTEAEKYDFIKNNIIKKYDDELSLKNSNFTINVEESNIVVEKFFRIGKLYYRNFMGIDLVDIQNKAIEEAKKNDRHKYVWNYNPETKYTNMFSNENNIYNHFIRSRANVIFNELKAKKIIPEYKKFKREYDKPSYLKLTVGKGIATIKLYINLELRDDFSKNISLMNKFVNETTNIIDKHMNYQLYK